MEVGGGAAAVVEPGSARPPSEGAGVGDLVPLQKRIPARSRRAALLPRRACVDPQRAAHIPGDVAARRAPAGAAPPASSAPARRSGGGAGGAAPGEEGHGRRSSCLLFPGSGRPAPSPAPLPSLPRIRPDSVGGSAEGSLEEGRGRGAAWRQREDQARGDQAGAGAAPPARSAESCFGFVVGERGI